RDRASGARDGRRETSAVAGVVVKKALVVAPGRGSYGRDSLRGVNGHAVAGVDAFDAWRAANGRPTVRDLDQRAKYDLKEHVAGEHASILTPGVSFAGWEASDR